MPSQASNQRPKFWNVDVSATTMSVLTIPATTLPRYLLPRLSWCPITTRPAALGALEARRHRSSYAPRRGGNLPVATTLQQQCIRQWKKTSPQFTTGSLAAVKARRQFSATAAQRKDHHFDTLKFVQRLKDEGFTEEQAEGMMKVLSDVIEERYISQTHVKLPKTKILAASKTSHAQWYSAKTRSAQPTPRKSTLPNSAPNS